LVVIAVNDDDAVVVVNCGVLVFVVVAALGGMVNVKHELE